ncbi:flagellar hook-associated protein FlgL [Litoreibacter arenae]|uniref:Flagellar hook-associated protein FlgL n=1 Tax=Litoreibacter arenae DSM 19593 TaxID=1123360 RepID=S9Q7J7_9RHOB|nr:flagellar hook-associated protein FlgL [Litoreibacter arenae]EPX77356.1 Flagellar hook-associated protein FlgL [Litoreibacter arenae DSM 19593]
MNYGSLSDLGQNMMLRRQGAGLKTSLSTLTTELTTGRRENVSDYVRGDFGPLAALERSVKRLDGFALGRDALSLRVTGVQTSLGAMQDTVATFGTDLIGAASLEQPGVLDAKLANAPERFNQVVSYLNAQVSGQYLFSGVASDRKPLPDGAELLTHIRNIAMTATDASDFVTQVNSWFDDSGGGFDTLAYNGAAQAQSGVAISEAHTIGLPVKADDGAIRSMLRDLAIAAVVSEGTLPMSDMEKRAVLSSVGEGLIASEQALISMRRDTGVTEQLLSEADVAGRVERGLLDGAISKITSADPYETASALEAVQHQIETLYVLTARTSQLRLSDYLR